MLKQGFKITVISLITILLCASNAFAFESVKFAIREICGHMQGNLGGLLMTVAGVGGITAAAFGNLRASHSLIVTGIGAAAIATVLSLYFPAAAKECKGNNGGLQGVDGNGQGAANLARTTNNFDPRANFNNALAIANGQDVNLNADIEFQADDEGINEFPDGF